MLIGNCIKLCFIRTTYSNAKYDSTKQIERWNHIAHGTWILDFNARTEIALDIIR